VALASPARLMIYFLGFAKRNDLCCAKAIAIVLCAFSFLANQVYLLSGMKSSKTICAIFMQTIVQVSSLFAANHYMQHASFYCFLLLFKSLSRTLKS
jgi:hypothetical protein